MASLAVRLVPEPVRSIGFAAIGPAYMGVGTAMTQPIRMFILQNLTNVALMVSFDGVNDNMPMAERGYIIFDVAANKGMANDISLARGQRIYVKHLGVAPVSGSFYLTTFYGSEV